jgi:UDP-N-acetylmuramoyl-tripeptide--D-alanyl-D-alanine ligase
MSAVLTRWFDWFDRHAKPAMKAVYRPPITEVARVWRNMLVQTCFIGVTGSAGKTTTKDLLHAALSGLYRCTKNNDSDNELFDVTRTLLRSRPHTQFCVQEVGASRPGKFEPMLALLKPRVGVVTNVGKDHLGSFRTLEGVAAEKVKLIASLPADGIAVLNADEPLVAAMASSCRARVVTFGLRSDAQFRGEMVTDRWPSRLALKIHDGNDVVLVSTRFLPGYQANNVLAAVATACSLGVPLQQAALSVSAHEPLLARMSVHATARGVTFIRDDVKAPEWSLNKAIQYMANAQAERKLIVLGTISEQGNKSNIYRRAVEAALAAADYVVVTGERPAAAARALKGLGGDKLIAFETVKETADWLGGFARSGDLVLLKGSIRADHLARVALAFDHDVRCWRSRCPRMILCDRCWLLRIPASP